MCTSGRVVGQSYFLCANNGDPAPVYDWVGGLLTGPEWRVELYGGPTPDSLAPAVGYGTEIRFPVSFYRPGYFQGPGLVIPSVAAFGWAWLQVRAWDANLGATYEEALARGLGGHGQSTPFYAQGTSPSCQPPCAPAALFGLQSFSVFQTVPEPSTWLLLVLGVGGLAWRRRRRRSGRHQPWHHQ